MTANDALQKLYSVADDSDLSVLDELCLRAGFRTPLVQDEDGGPYYGGEMVNIDEIQAPDWFEMTTDERA